MLEKFRAERALEDGEAINDDGGAGGNESHIIGGDGSDFNDSDDSDINQDDEEGEVLHPFANLGGEEAES